MVGLILCAVYATQGESGSCDCLERDGLGTGMLADGQWEQRHNDNPDLVER